VTASVEEQDAVTGTSEEAPCRRTTAARLRDGIYQPDNLTPSLVRKLAFTYGKPLLAGVADPSSGRGTLVAYTASATGATTTYPTTSTIGTARSRRHPCAPRTSRHPLAPTASNPPVSAISALITSTDRPVVVKCEKAIVAPTVAATMPSAIEPIAAPRRARVRWRSTTEIQAAPTASSRTTRPAGEPSSATMPPRPTKISAHEAFVTRRACNASSTGARAEGPHG
jgi:hypothetical protein